jgi:hypothetical protein
MDMGRAPASRICATSASTFTCVRSALPTAMRVSPQSTMPYASLRSMSHSNDQLKYSCEAIRSPCGPIAEPVLPMQTLAPS